MKRLIGIVICAVVLSVSFAGCSDSGGNVLSLTPTEAAELTDSQGIGYKVNEDGDLTVLNSPKEIKSFTVSSQFDGKKVASIGRSAFKMSDAEKITVEDGITVIEDHAFAFSDKLEEVILPEGIEKISNNAFAGCVALKTIKLPSTVKTIDIFAFDASGLETIELPNKVKSIGQLAFAQCTNLKTVKIPNKKAKIEDNTFKDCPELTLLLPKGSEIIKTAKKLGIRYKIVK